MKQVILLILSISFALPAFADTTYVYHLPFEEDFNTGTFTANQWIIEGANWHIAGQQGNPPPSAIFAYAPVDTNYSLSLISPPIDGSGFISGSIYLDFELKADVINASGLEKLSAEVFDGIQWVTYFTDSAVSDFDWKTKHVNITPAAKGDTFQIRFRAYGENTLNIYSWLIDNINIYRLCKVPVDLVTSFPDPINHGDRILLEWLPPGSPGPEVSGWLNWDDGTNVDAIGLTGGGTFFAGVRFTSTQLAEYPGSNLTRIRMFPFAPNGNIILKVWTGFNANTLVLSQPVSSYTAGQWNEFELNTPISVTGITELWIGYEVTHDGTNYVAGVDGGPAVEGYGDLISLDGSVWESMLQAYQLDYNWNLQGFFETDTIITDTLDVQGYNVFIEKEWLAYTTELWYIDEVTSRNTYCYNVSAVYQDCESKFSNMSCEWVNTHNFDLKNIEIYPNPASNNVKFDFAAGIRQILVYNLVGEIKSEFDVQNGQSVLQMDLTDYHSGIYLVKFMASEGESIVKKLIVVK